MNEKQKQVLFAIFVIVVLIALSKLYKGIDKGAKQVGDKLSDFGITESDKAEALKKMEAFRPSYYKNLKGSVRLLKMQNAKDLAKEIYNSRTAYVYTDDARILGVFKKLSTKSQVSFLAEVFQKEYGEDMLNFFFKPMTNDYLEQLYDLVKSLPKQ